MLEKDIMIGCRFTLNKQVADANNYNNLLKKR